MSLAWIVNFNEHCYCINVCGDLASLIINVDRNSAIITNKSSYSLIYNKIDLTEFFEFSGIVCEVYKDEIIDHIYHKIYRYEPEIILKSWIRWLKTKFAIPEPPTLDELIDLKLDTVGSLELIDKTIGINNRFIIGNGECKTIETSIFYFNCFYNFVKVLREFDLTKDVVAIFIGNDYYRTLLYPRNLISFDSSKYRGAKILSVCNHLGFLFDEFYINFKPIPKDPETYKLSTDTNLSLWEIEEI